MSHNDHYYSPVQFAIRCSYIWVKYAEKTYKIKFIANQYDRILARKGWILSLSLIRSYPTVRRGLDIGVVFLVYPVTSAVHPVSVLILHPRQIQIMWSDCQTAVRQKDK